MTMSRGGRDYGNRGLRDLSFLQRSNLPRKIIERANLVPSTQLSAPEQPSNVVKIASQLPSALNVAVKERISSSREGYTTHIVLLCYMRDSPDEDDRCLYVVDLKEEDSAEWSFKAPTIRFCSERFDFEAFCVLDNSLYIFEMHHRFEPETGKRVWKYKLPLSSEIVNRKLEKRDLVEVTPMKYPKFAPTATPTPDGKILVYAHTVGFGSRNNANKCDFELYDPKEQLWEQLPGLSYGEIQADKCTIYSMTFLNNEPVVLIETGFGMYTLDLRSSTDNKQWNMFIATTVDRFRPLHGIGPHFILLMDHLFLTSWSAYDVVGSNSGFFEYPQLSIREYDFLSRRYDILLLNMMIKNRGCYFCIMELRLMKEGMIPHLVIYVYRFDYNKFKEDLEKGKMEGGLLPGTKVIKKLKFVLSPQESSDYFEVLSFFYNPRENN